MKNPASFFARHEFLIRRLHSLCGLVPVGAYMTVHLLTNASVLESPAAFQRNVYTIHSLGSLLPVVEWGFIFIPILFHALLGVVFMTGWLPNTGSYPYPRNYRYTLQRVTGGIAFLFILAHVFHMHGWFHNAWWLQRVARPLGGAEFAPYNAASSSGLALQDFGWVAVYIVGVLSCVYHLSNGIWTMGITWGVWISPGAQRRANWACAGFGVVLAAVGMGALFGMRGVASNPASLEAAVQVEDAMYKAKVRAQETPPDEHKRSSPAGREKK